MPPTTAPSPTITMRPGWREMFASEQEAITFARLRAGEKLDGRAVSLRPLGTGCTPLLLRPETSDPIAFEAAFAGKRHVPPFTLPRGGTILDLGCGPGYSCAGFAFRDAECRVCAVDLDTESLALAEQNSAGFQARFRSLNAAAWGETGRVAFGGSSRDAWSRQVVQLGAYPEMDRLNADGSADAFRVDALMDHFGLARVDHIHMDIAGSEAAVFDQPAKWLSRVGSIRIHISRPASVQKIESRLVEQGLIVRLDPRDPSVVTGITRAFAAAQPRYPKNANQIDPPPPPY